MFLEPLMLKLEETNKGYKLEEDEDPIPGGAYADDMVLHTNSRNELQKLLNICNEYFEYVGLDIAVDGRDKSVYTSNTGTPLPQNMLKITKYVNGIPETKILPYYKKNESYKYLGLWINLDLSWEEQTKISNFTYNKYISYLYKKCFNASQTVEILNLVVFPSITYRMNIMKYPDETIKKWDKQARNLLAYKLRVNQFIGCVHWYLPNNKAGYNLFKLSNLQKICLSANYLNYCANFIDKNAQRSAKAVFGKSKINMQISELLTKYKMDVIINPAFEEDWNETNPLYYFKGKTLSKKLLENGIDSVHHLIEDDNTLLEFEKLNELFDTNWSKREYNNIKKNLCNKNETTIKEKILKRLNRRSEWDFAPEDFFYDEELQGYEIYIDESLKKKKAGYGIYMRKKHKYNYYDQVEGEQTLSNATLQGILHVLQKFPLDEPIIFMIDRKVVIDVMENIPISYKDQQEALHLDTIKQIKNAIQLRIAPIKFNHVYSHTNENNDQQEKLAINMKKKEKMIEKYGEKRTDRYVLGNSEADKLADKAFE